MLRAVRCIPLFGSRKNASDNKLNYSAATTAGLNRLVEVGVLEDPKQYDCYQSGQLFLHKIFGYRGVVLFNWVSKVYDRDNQEARTSFKVDCTFSRCDWEEEGVVGWKMKDLKFEKKTYYQVLIDQRDFHQVRSPPDGITLTIDGDDNALYSISGLDYVCHDHVLPYTSTCDGKDLPIHHDLYPQFFATDHESILSSWQQRNTNWLQQVDIHCETTKDVKITVMPFYLGCREVQKSYLHWWRYCIRIENIGSVKVQLRQRHWRIFSSSGTLETVRGDGVIGQQPVLTINQPAFQYSSHVSLQSSSGHMWGTFRFEAEDGRFFDVRIPPFNLASSER